MKKKIILASSSPRRRELLGSLLRNFGLNFKVIPANIEEILPDFSTNPARLVRKLAEQKATFIGKKHKGVIIGADTIVVLNNRLLGKPVDANDARKMLKHLSGKYHTVYTGISIVDSASGKKYSVSEKTIVKFRRLKDKEIIFYVKTGSSFDKAGAYGIQDDFGSTFISAINGDFFSVVGLPIVKTYTGLKKFLKLGV